MELEKIQKKEIKSKTITIRTYPKSSKWMKENNVSPTALFNQAINELMEKTAKKS